jgi:hypothetical protein
MKESLSHYLLPNSPYLLVGVGLYFLLTSFKVHMVWYIQPRLFDPAYENRLFHHYFRHYCSIVFSSNKLFTAVIPYLLQRQSEQFKVLDTPESKPIKLRLNILKQLTDILKPYLFFALFWLIVKYMIQLRLFYQPLQVTLGEVQQMMTFLKGCIFFGWLNDYESEILIVVGILCILIPFLATRGRVTEKVKRWFSLSLIYLSLLGSVTFFGADIGNLTDGKRRALVALQADVMNTHDKIFREAASEVIANDFTEQLETENDTYNKESGRYDSISNIPIAALRHIEVIDKVRAQLASHAESFRNNHTITRSALIEQAIQEVKAKQGTAASFFAANTGAPPAPVSPTEEYLYYPENWNKATGDALLADVEQVLANNSKAATVTESRIRAVLDLVVEYVFDQYVKEILVVAKLERHQIIQKVFAAVATEAYKERLVNRCIDLIDFIKRTKKLGPQPVDPIKPSVRPGLKEVVAANDNFIKESKASALAEDKSITETIRKEEVERVKAEIERAKAAKRVEQLAKTSEWESLRRRLLKEINNGSIGCPDILEKRLAFKEALESWTAYLDERKVEVMDQADIEIKFSSFVKQNSNVQEAFARGIAWYKGAELPSSVQPAIKEALKYYQRFYPSLLSDQDITDFMDKLDSPIACKGR